MLSLGTSRDQENSTTTTTDPKSKKRRVVLWAVWILGGILFWLFILRGNIPPMFLSPVVIRWLGPHDGFVICRFYRYENIGVFDRWEVYRSSNGTWQGSGSVPLECCGTEIKVLYWLLSNDA